MEKTVRIETYIELRLQCLFSEEILKRVKYNNRKRPIKVDIKEFIKKINLLNVNKMV